MIKILQEIFLKCESIQKQLRAIATKLEANSKTYWQKPVVGSKLLQAEPNISKKEEGASLQLESSFVVCTQSQAGGMTETDKKASLWTSKTGIDEALNAQAALLLARFHAKAKVSEATATNQSDGERKNQGAFLLAQLRSKQVSKQVKDSELTRQFAYK